MGFVHIVPSIPWGIKQCPSFHFILFKKFFFFLIYELQYCTFETGRENKVPFHFPFISPTCFTQIPQMGIFVKQFSFIFPLFLRYGGISFPCQFSPNFPRISPKFSSNSPRIPRISQLFLLISQFPVQFSIQLHKGTLSLSIRPILGILHVSLKMRIPHYARQRIINLGNSGEIQGILGKSDKKLFIFFHSFSQVWNTFLSCGNLISPISPVATVKTGENSCEKKWKGIHRETWIPISFPLPTRPVSITQYCSHNFRSIVVHSIFSPNILI